MWATWAAWLSLALYGFMVGVAMSVMPRDWQPHNRFLAGLVWPFSLPVWAGKRVGDRELAGVHRRRRRSLPAPEFPEARALRGGNHG